MAVPLLVLTFAGVMALVTGALMAINATLAYVTVVPQSPAILAIYLPLSVLFLALGVYWLARAQRRYEAGRVNRGPSTV